MRVVSSPRDSTRRRSALSSVSFDALPGNEGGVFFVWRVLADREVLTTAKGKNSVGGGQPSGVLSFLFKRKSSEKTNEPQPTGGDS